MSTRRRRLLTAVSLLTAWCLLVGDGLAQEPTRPSLPPPPSFPIPPPPPSLSSSDAFALWNECAPIRLIVESLSSTDAADIDLTEERIQTLAESRLRAARLYDAAARPYLYVRVGVLVSENRSGGAYSIGIFFKKYLGDGVSEQSGLAATWETGNYGTHGGDAGYIMQIVSEYLDRFILEYLRVNETACR